MSDEDKYTDLVRDRRQQIFMAAAKVFAKYGYHNSKVSMIASEAGLGKGTIYEYVKSKSELLQLVLEEGHNYVLTKVDEVIEKELEPEQTWKEAIGILFSSLDEFDDAARALMPELIGLEITEFNKMEETALRFISRFSKIYDSGVKAGVFRDIDSSIICEMILDSCMLWTKSNSIVERCDGDINKFKDMIFDVTFNGIRK